MMQMLISLPYISTKKIGYCHYEPWMGYYTLVTGVVVPLSINITLNVLILIHVRSSTRRVQTRSTDTSAQINNNQQVKITRRDISLMKHMIFMFSMFIIGWTPVLIIYLINIIFGVLNVTIHIAVICSQVCIAGIVVNLFVYNHEMKQYLSNRIRLYF
ncbi:unnamed protein product [Adineta ricciae]|uniref:G-protein coupled receptors family 1 profile domain-containing protein n=1 Tax=Adineta ricciae TaxID=249248 RepID=A0A815QYW9_ADIRI|nr:unnamed protein product [Adineta ricciae]